MARSKQKTQQSRRKLLAALSAGAVAKLPDLWSKPTVASVMLPAHAAGSPPDSSSGCTEVRLLANLSPGSESLTFRLAAFGTDLPPGGDFFASFTFFTFQYSLAATSVAPSVYGAIMPQSVTYPITFCYGQSITVNFYSQGGSGSPLCGTIEPAVCASTTIGIPDGP